MFVLMKFDTVGARCNSTAVFDALPRKLFVTRPQHARSVLEIALAHVIDAVALTPRDDASMWRSGAVAGRRLIVARQEAIDNRHRVGKPCDDR
jgi:hypothetical protein